MRFSAMKLFTSLLLLSTILTGQGYATQLDDILERHLTSLGGREAVAAVKSSRVYSSIKYMDIEGKSVSWLVLPNRFRSRIDLGIFGEEKGFDGIVAWAVDANGIVRHESAEEMKPTISELYRVSFSYLFPGRNPGRAEYASDTLIDNQIFHKVEMCPEGGNAFSAFFNTETGRLEYIVEMLTGLKTVTHYADFREVEGLELPFYARLETPGAPYEITSVIDSIDINPVLPDSIFTVPGSSLDDFDLPPNTDSVSVPLKLADNGLFVEVTVNGRGPFRFLLDTGSASNVLSRKTADDLGIDYSHSVPARGIGGHGQIGLATIDSLGLGPVHWRSRSITVFDFGSSKLGRKKVEGILGYDFFTRFAIRLNLNDSTMTLYDLDNPPTEPDGDHLDISLYFQIPLVEAMLDGHPARLAFDLGAELGLAVQGDSRWYRAISADSEQRGPFMTIEGIGGRQQVRRIELDKLELGPYNLENQSALVIENQAGVPFPEYVEGFLGMGLLKRFNLLIVYDKGKVYLTERTRQDK